MEVRILGPFELTVRGEPLELRSGTQRAVLTALAVRAGQVVQPDAVVDAVWGDAPPPSAKGSLQAHLSRLRRTLAQHGATDVVVTRPEGYVLSAEVDAANFENGVAAGRRALAQGDAALATERLGDALELWRGPPLTDAADNPDLAATRQRLERVRDDAAELRLRAALSMGADVVADAERLVADQPLRETAWAVLMQALYGTGRGAEALRAYERARETLAEELGVGPGPELRRLHAELLRADAAAALPRPRSNLPRPLTSFVGRRSDLARILVLLDTRALVTLVGIGGAGKTRLAVESARAAAEAFPDGVWFADLTAVAEPGHVGDAVAAAVGVREVAGEPLEDRVAAVLRDARALVVLDNCEHVLDAAANLVARLLAACPQLTVLATSREPLQVAGEALHEVAGLTLPTEDDTEGEALRLLTERAADAAPGVTLDPATAATICRQLDGLPLAIEIVAPHLRALPLADIAQRLRGRFLLDAAGSRVAPERHRTLDGAIAWSCDLISEEERLLLGRLSVFPGSFSLDAAEAVAGDARLLPQLAARSLVTVEESGRYRLLETVRAYARVYLVRPEEPLNDRLAAWVEAFVTTAEPHLTGPGQATWLERLAVEQDNVHAALEVGLANDVGGAVSRIAVPQLLFWVIRGRMIEARTWLTHALVGCPEPDRQRLHTLNALTVALENVQGPSPELDALLTEARTLAEDLGDDDGAAWNACWSGLVACWTDLDRARDELRVALARFAALGEPWGRGLVGAYLAFVERLRGDFDEAERVATEAAATFDGLGEAWGGALCRTTLGVLARHRGEMASSRALFRESLASFLELDSPDGAIICFQGLGSNAEVEGDLPQARELFMQGLEMARRAGSVTHVAENLAQLGWISFELGDRAEALGWLREFAHDRDANRYGRCVASGLDLAARLLAGPDPQRAARLHGAAAAARTRLGEEPRPELAARIAVARRELTDTLGDDGLAAASEAGADADPLAELRASLDVLPREPRPAREVSSSAASARADGDAGMG